MTTRQKGIGKNPTARHLPCLGSDIHHLSTGASHTPIDGRLGNARGHTMCFYFLSLPCVSCMFCDAQMKLQIKVLYQFFTVFITGLYYFVFHSGCANFGMFVPTCTHFPPPPPQLPLFKLDTAALKFLKGWLANRFFHSLPFCT